MKTLRDIVGEILDDSEEEWSLACKHFKDALREAAKEEVKKLGLEAAIAYEEIGDDREVYGIKCEIAWIKHFFNLEEEE